VHLKGQGLLLVPSVFVWPSIAVHTDVPWPRSLVYPARGIAGLWETPPAGTPGALSGLVGGARVRLLTALREPVGTTSSPKPWDVDRCRQ